MSVSEIVELVPPPGQILYAGDDKSWAKVENSFPFHLPGDFREYLKIFGYGVLGEMLVVLSPFHPKRRENFLSTYDAVGPDLITECEYADWLDDSNENDPGLIRFGFDTSGNY